jgi:hypothetical protein
MNETAPGLADDQMNDFVRAIQRVRAEYLEMPGLTLTVSQASCLWSFEAGFCMAVLIALEEAKFLVRTRTPHLHAPAERRWGLSETARG